MAKEVKSLVKQCPKCHSLNVRGYAIVTGYAYIDLSDMSVYDVETSDLEIDTTVDEFICDDCDHEWDDDTERKKSMAELMDKVKARLVKIKVSR